MSQEPSFWDRLKKLFGIRPADPGTPQPAPPPVGTEPPPAPQVGKEPPPAPPVYSIPPPREAPVSSSTGAVADFLRRNARSESLVTPPTPPTPAVSSGPLIDLILGIDFGTSCTKVVIGDPGWRDQAFPVPFGEPLSNLRSWLHATRLGNEANLKMRLMDDPASPIVRDLAARYLATVIQHAKSWFEQHAPPEYRRGQWNWSLNLGFPAKSVRAGDPVTDAYRAVAHAALEMIPSMPGAEVATESTAGGRSSSAFIPASRVYLYPEIAAQLAGYIRSPYRQFGNLLLVDVGAGTLDVSTLIIHPANDEEVVSFHVCDVKPLGVLRLYQARADALNGIGGNRTARSLEAYQDGCTVVPDTTGEMLDPAHGLPTPTLKRAFNEATEHFAEQVLGTVLPCLTRFRTLQRSAHHNTGFDPWPRHLRFFLTGGGGRAEFYREQLVDGPLEEQLVRFTRWHHDPSQRRANGQGLRLESMPVPRNLLGFPASLTAHFDRLSVAYGLAQGAENLMRLTSAEEPANA